MKNLISKLTLSILIIAISLIYGLPHLLLISKLGDRYTPFTLTGSPIARDEAFAYAPEVNYILKGHLFLKEAYVREYSNYPTPFMGESAPSLVFALLTILTGSIENGFIAGDFIFPPMIFLLLYLVTRMFIKNNLYSAAVAFIAVIARDFIAVIPYPHATIQYLSFAEGQNYLLYFSRAFHPQLTFVFFTLCFISFFKLIQFPSVKKYIFVSGVLLGLLFYSYLFYWTYFVAFYFSLIAYFLIKKEKQILIALTFSGLIAFVLATPYIYNIIQFYNLDIADDFTTKSSLKNLPIPATLARYLSIAVVFFINTRREEKKFNMFCLFILVGVLITPASKLIIGQDLETFHYLRRALMPYATIAIFISFHMILKDKKTLLKVLSIIILIVFTVFGFNAQTTASAVIQPGHVQDVDRAKVFQWLQSNTPKESVVGSINTDFESLAPIYTHNAVFFPPTDRTVTPTFEGVTRYTLVANLLGISSEWQKKNLDDIISYLYVYQSYDGNQKLNLNSNKRKEAEDEIDYQSQGLWKESLKKYMLDYVVVTPEEINQIRVDLTILKYEASFGNYFIYSMNK